MFSLFCNVAMLLFFGIFYGVQVSSLLKRKKGNFPAYEACIIESDGYAHHFNEGRPF